MEQKKVKIIGLSVNKDFGGLKATNLQFSDTNKLTIVKGEVGSGKTTLNKSLSLVTKGSKTLKDNHLYGDDVDLTAQLLDGKHKVFVNCKSNKNGELVHSIYTIDDDGNKLKDVVIDGKKLTPANYLSSLQTSLTWRLDELTSENPITQRNLLLELYQNELIKLGIIFDKKHPDYVGGLIDKIEKAKNDRNYADMKRKEVGGIADDLNKKGIDSSERRELKIDDVTSKINDVNSKISLASTNIAQTRENELNKLKASGSELNNKLMLINGSIKNENSVIDGEYFEYNNKITKINEFLDKMELNSDDVNKLIISKLIKPTSDKSKEIEFNAKGQCVSELDGFKVNIQELLNSLNVVKTKYGTLLQTPTDKVDTSELEKELAILTSSKESIDIWNNEAKSINALHDWKEANEIVKDCQTNYYKQLISIDTGVEGLKICPESKESNDIFLMYDGSYDTDYFHNKDKKLRKLSAYSDTQKPLICLLIQNYLLSKKPKTLPYLWIDKVPIDNKTKALLEKMSDDLGLWLFVSWTGDFATDNLKDGELLIENGEIFFNK